MSAEKSEKQIRDMPKAHNRVDLSYTLMFFTMTVLLVIGSAYLCMQDSLFRIMMVLAQQSDLLAQRYYGELEPEQIFDDAWRGMQRALPFKAELRDEPLRLDSETPSSDWGLTIQRDSAGFRIEAITHNSRLAGSLMPGDVIVALQTEDGRAPADLVSFLNESRGDTVRALVDRGGDEKELAFYVPVESAADAVTCDTIQRVVYLDIEKIASATEQRVRECLKVSLGSDPRGLIVDLRASSGSASGYGAKEINDLAETLADSFGSRERVVMVDQNTTGNAEQLARVLADRYQFSVVGNETLGLSAARDEIVLRSGRRLYVSSREQATASDEGEFAVDSISDSSHRRAEGAGIKPDIECEPFRMPEIIFQIIHQGHLHDFILQNQRATLPSRNEESELFDAFKSYLDDVGFTFDPIRNAADALKDYRSDSDVRLLVDEIERKAESEGDVTLDDMRDEILRYLLTSIYRTWIGGQLTGREKLRLQDHCLEQAIAEIEG